MPPVFAPRAASLRHNSVAPEQPIEACSESRQSPRTSVELDRIESAGDGTISSQPPPDPDVFRASSASSHSTKKVRVRPPGLNLSNSESAFHSGAKTVAWATGVEQDEETDTVGKLTYDYVPLTPAPANPRESFTFATRRLTYDFTTAKFFSRLPPTTRNKLTIFLYLFFGASLLIIALALGIKLLGRPYDPERPVSEPDNGKLTGAPQFMGIVLLLYAGSGGIMLLANLLPSLVVVDLPFKVVRAIILFCAVLCIIGIALVLKYMVQPEETFAPTTQEYGLEDPMLASVGVNFIIAFFFLFFISIGILAHMFEFMQRLRKGLHSAANRINYRTYAFLLLVLFFAFTLSNFMCNPVGAGETWSGPYFRSSSPYSLVNWKWNNNFVYKLFPDVMAYYLFIFVVVSVAVVARRNVQCRYWLHRRCWSPSGPWTQTKWFEWHPFPYGISNGEVILISSFAMFFIFWVVYWRIVFDYSEKKLDAISIVNVQVELAARNMGHISNLFSAITLFPASRTGLWVEVFGVPYDRCIRYHRILGTLAVTFSTVHGMLWWCKWLKEGHLGDNVFSIDHLWISSERVSYMDWSIPIAETAWALILLSIISAVALRRKLYPVFQYSHKYIGVVFYISVIYHAWSFWYFAAGALFVWYVDKISRAVRAARLHTPVEMGWVPQNAMVRIKLGTESYKHYHPGQYFFVNIPQISINEWHPFTASAVTDDGIIFYIKAMPKNPALARVPWTQRLADLVQTAAALPMLRLSGPFGHTDFEGYESLVMFAGGIGITPMIAIFTDLMHRAKQGRPVGRLQSVALVWMSRSVAEFRVFEEIFAMVHSASVLADEHARVDTKACNFHVRLHCTRRESWVSMNTPSSTDHVKMFVAQGRCDVAGRIEEFASPDPTRTMVAVCGPSNLTHTASRAAWIRRTDFHAEQFSF